MAVNREEIIEYLNEASIHGDQAIPRPHPGSGASGMTVKQKEQSL